MRCPHTLAVRTVTAVSCGSTGRGGIHPIQVCWMMETGLMLLPPLPPHTYHMNIKYPEWGGWKRCPHTLAVHTVTAVSCGGPGSGGIHPI